MGNQIKKLFTMKFALLATAVAAKHHHHHHEYIATEDMAELNAMSETKLVNTLRSTLGAALNAEARDDKAAAVPRPLPSRTSRRLLPLESSRDSMTDNHSLRSPER